MQIENASGLSCYSERPPMRIDFINLCPLCWLVFQLQSKIQVYIGEVLSDRLFWPNSSL